ncbi:hypothetical protein M5G07_06945 [Serratia symbiotica]|nr:hypothetical protein [Serratia symbiotica]
MRMLLTTSYLQRDLGIVLLRLGSGLLHYFSGHGRLLIAPEPEEYKPPPSGLLPAVNQHLSADSWLSSFLLHERVIDAAGGVS